VGHHGSKTSSTGEFVRALAPEHAVISVGNNNHFGHSHPDTLRRLGEQKVSLYRTDRDGVVVFDTDGMTISTATFVQGNAK
jgi:competence protein ComEC